MSVPAQGKPHRMGIDPRISRSDFFRTVAVLGAAVAAQPAAFPQTPEEWTEADLARAERLAGITLTEDQRKALLRNILTQADTMKELRAEPIPNHVVPMIPFRVWGRQGEPGTDTYVEVEPRGRIRRPERESDLMFLTVADLGHLIRTRQVTSRLLTEVSLERLRTLGPKLNCVISLLEDRALALADTLDEETKRGRLRSHLHGIPVALKDLYSAQGAPTTWGAAPYQNQYIDSDAEVVKKLEAAGAVPVAKTSVGALAYGDVWFGGLTRNPWNPEQGSSGSSAGSAAAVAAGLVPFAMGTETLGSIVSPAQRCRVTGYRPTFGFVSRAGAMALSWTMDKCGPLCRTAEDAALAMSAIVGVDAKDPATIERPFRYRPLRNLKNLKIAHVATTPLERTETASVMETVLGWVRELEGDPQPAIFTGPQAGIDDVLVIEAAAAFDDLTTSGRVDEMKGSLWPPIFRSAMFFTGVDYLQAMRKRTLLQQAFESEFGDYDVIIAPDRAGELLITTNLTGHPQIYIPLGPDEQGRPQGFSIVGRLYEDAKLLAIADLIQRKSDWYLRQPDLSGLA